MAQCTCPSGDGSLRWPCPVHNQAKVLRMCSILKSIHEAWDHKDEPDGYERLKFAIESTRTEVQW